jgi:hypothetical protein
MASSNAQVLHFAKGSPCRVEFFNNTFHFFGLRPEKPCLKVQPKHMLDVCGALILAKEKAARCQAETDLLVEDQVLASFPIARVDTIETVLDVSCYMGNVSVWLKTFNVTNTGVRRGLPGWVIMNDMDGYTLKEFYAKCMS